MEQKTYNVTSTENSLESEDDPLCKISVLFWAPKWVAMIRKTTDEIQMHTPPAVRAAVRHIKYSMSVWMIAKQLCKNSASLQVVT